MSHLWVTWPQQFHSSLFAQERNSCRWTKRHGGGGAFHCRTVAAGEKQSLLILGKGCVTQRASQAVLVVKNPPANAGGTRDVGLIPGSGRSPSPQSRKWQPIPVFLPGRSQGQRSPVGYSPWGSKESDTTEWVNTESYKMEYHRVVIFKWTRSFPGGPVVKNSPANAGARVRSLVWEASTCHRGTKPVCPSYGACTPRAWVLQQEKPHSEKPNTSMKGSLPAHCN